MKRDRWLLVASFILGVFIFRPSESRNVEAALLQSNILQNPGFEEPYSNGIAQSWAPQHQDANANPKPAECGDYYTVRPQWSAELASTDLILNGGRSQHIGNQFDTWDAVVMQTVPVTAGSSYRFSFWATGRASNDQYPAPSDTSVNMKVQAGIDPAGRGNYVSYGNQIAWGAAGSPHMSGSQGNWQQFTVEATATANQITVFARANFGGANQCRKHLDVWFDKAELVTAGPPPTSTSPPLPTSPPQPAATSTPIPPPATDTPEIAPSETPLPTPLPTDTPQPIKGGVICVNAFADINANGQRDADEGYMAGVTFTIAQENQVVAQGVSTGTNSPICFENIPAGTYVVAQVIPRNLEMTTAASAAIEVTDGSTISLEFGSRIKSDINGEDIDSSSTPVPPTSGGSQDGSSGDDEGVSLLALVGLGAIFVAILLLGALIVLLLRQQRT